MAKKLSGIDMMREDWLYRNRGYFSDRFISLILEQNSARAKVHNGWRITVYEPVREYLDLEIGDLLRATVQKDEGSAHSRP